MSRVPQGFRRISENRIRESVGLGLEDFSGIVGTVIEHRPARTVTETEHVQILALTGNEAPVHSDIEFCPPAPGGACPACAAARWRPSPT